MESDVTQECFCHKIDPTQGPCQDCARHRANHAQGEPVAWMIDNGPKLGKAFFCIPTCDAVPLYTHPPAQDVAALVSALERIDRMSNTATDFVDLAKLIARTALAKFGEKP